MDIENLGSV